VGTRTAFQKRTLEAWAELTLKGERESLRLWPSCRTVDPKAGERPAPGGRERSTSALRPIVYRQQFGGMEVKKRGESGKKR
jgi:hypothetical protein